MIKVWCCSTFATGRENWGYGYEGGSCDTQSWVSGTLFILDDVQM
jgi:hypothetical protein